jgi:hypothetical protein
MPRTQRHKRTNEKYWRLSFRPRIACLLREPGTRETRVNNLKGANSKNGLAAQHQGLISQNAKAKMMNAILWLDAQAQWKWCYSKSSGKWFRWRLNFIHLTLPAQGNKKDTFIKKLLNQFFLYAYRKTGMRSYVWKAEPQKRGEIHFHITSDCFIWKKTLQNIWNGILRKHGLLGTHEDPPSTRVHPTHNIREMTSYLIKYMTKNDSDRRTIQGRLWGCSRNLSSAKSIYLTMKENEAFQEFKNIPCLPQDQRSYDWVQIKYLSPVYFESLPDCELLQKYRERIRQIRKGYAPTKNFFFDENGNPITYQEAEKKGLKEMDKFLYQFQLEYN